MTDKPDPSALSVGTWIGQHIVFIVPVVAAIFSIGVIFESRNSDVSGLSKRVDTMEEQDLVELRSVLDKLLVQVAKNTEQREKMEALLSDNLHKLELRIREVETQNAVADQSFISVNKELAEIKADMRLHISNDRAGTEQ